MHRTSSGRLQCAATTIVLAGLVSAGAGSAISAEPDKETFIRDALSAAPPAVASTATVMTMDNKVLKQGTGAYTCFATPADELANGLHEPMCLDKPWVAWADAWMNKKPFKAERSGIAYMLAGDTGASNTDPYATAKTADNQWVVEGPHIMVLLPDPAQLDAFPTDPNSGGPYVMWKGTPYAHIMVPVAARPTGKE
ncbi:MAG: hypothetical protein JOY71_01645 [Acetobacteraceae bacterium]|nr:hypothetical protein [Acetobacteraceae bacterium]MBV8591349.1 hypothetical protein [Acetobacteraceae bacterium]